LSLGSFRPHRSSVVISRSSLFVLSLLIVAPFVLGTIARAGPQIELVPEVPHTLPVTSVAFSPNGKLVLSGSEDKTLKLWDASTGALVRSFEGHLDEVTSVAFSPDGTRVLSGSKDKTVKLWDVATGTLLRTFEEPSDSLATYVMSVAFSPDGARVLSGNQDATLKLWDASTGVLLRVFTAHGSVASVAFSPNGTKLVAAEFFDIVLFDIATGTELKVFESAWANSVAFSPDGTRLVSGGDEKTVKLWDVESGAPLDTFKGHLDEVTSVAFSPDGTRVLSGSKDKTVKLWDVATGTLLRTFEGHLHDVLSVAFSPDGFKLLSGGRDETLKVWDVTGSLPTQSFEGHSSAISSVAFSPDGTRVVSGDRDKTVKLWDATSGALARIFVGHADYVSSVAFSPDGTRILSGSADRTVRLWETATGALLRTFQGHSDYVSSVAFSPDGTRVLSGSHDRTVKLWDVSTGALIRNFEGSELEVWSVAFSPDGAHVVSGGEDFNLRLWDVQTGALLSTFEGHDSWVNSVAFSLDGTRILSGSSDGTVKLWNASTGTLLNTFGESSDEHVRKVTLGLVSSAISPRTDVLSVALSPDGTYIAAADWDNKVKIWSVASGAQVRVLDGHSGPVRSVAFSRDGTRVVSAGDDGRLSIWNAAGSLLVSLFGGRDSNWLTLTPEGFFSASPKGEEILNVVRGLELTTIGQVHQSLFSPDLVREALARDPDGEVKRAAEVVNLEKVLDSGPAPLVEITSHRSGGQSDTDLVTIAARIKDRGKGIGRIEWRVNGVTTGVSNGPTGAARDYEVRQTLALDQGENTIEVIAYNARNLLASLPAQTTIVYNGPADAVKPKFYVLAIGINAYHDEGWTPPGATAPEHFPPLNLAVSDAKSIAEALQEAGAGLYGEVVVRTALDTEATGAELERVVREIAADINPRDTFVLFAAAHGYSNNGRFYLLPQDYNGGTDPAALASRAIGQERLQDWIANRIKAKKAIILLDTCQSGALTNGYAHSRIDAPASEAAVGRLHEATGRPVLTAAAAGKPAFEGYHGHGVFTWALIDALFHGDINGDGFIELSELATHVQNTVPKITAELNGRGIPEILIHLFGEKHQTAHFGSTGGDYALVRRLQ
jgi:WD40 repeat protein/uncharacterized caspase-like protein